MAPHGEAVAVGLEPVALPEEEQQDLYTRLKTLQRQVGGFAGASRE